MRVWADRWYPSSKTCSGCGSAKAKPTLAERLYVCDNNDCGLQIDRDLNAAVNLARLARAEQSACFDVVEPTVRRPLRRRWWLRNLKEAPRRKARLPDGTEHAHVCSPEGNGYAPCHTVSNGGVFADTRP